jgi:RND family efflux transporter MFP subunit
MFKPIALILVVLAVVSCKTEEKEGQKMARASRFEDKNVVVTDIAHKGTFYREFESNGRLEAVNKAVLEYELDEKILSVNVRDGQKVVKGQVLSVLDSTEQYHSHQKINREQSKVRLSLEDELINMGYQLSDSANVPKEIMQVALIRSGYRDVLGENKLSAIELNKTKVKAPFSGIVANVSAKPFNNSGQYDEFCTLIDNSSFGVSFPVLESEAFKLRQGMEVAIIPFAFDQDTILGKLTAINPLVEDNGMVTAKAVIENKTGRLAEGMNVKVIVREAVKNQFVIPKSAVTLRQEKNVVFVYKNDTAYWNYVTVEEENSHYCTIKSKKIKAGDEVIVDGNFNLSHLAPVVKMN